MPDTSKKITYSVYFEGPSGQLFRSYFAILGEIIIQKTLNYAIIDGVVDGKYFKRGIYDIKDHKCYILVGQHALLIEVE